LSESNNIENRTNSVTGARTTSPFTSNNIAHPCNTTSTAKQRIAPPTTQQMQGPSANANATNTRTRKRRGGKENQQITRKSQIPSKIGAETKSQLEKKVNVLIVGNSNLRNVTEEKLTNDRRNLIVRFKPGMKIEEANKSADSKTEFDVIIVHAGTDKIRESTPKDLTDTIVNTLDKIQKSNPTARVAYSSIFKRNDDQILNIKSKKVNEPLEEKLSIVGMDIINNNKVLYRNLWSPSKRWMCA